jgi:hypothetical protein
MHAVHLSKDHLLPGFGGDGLGQELAYFTGIKVVYKAPNALGIH